MKKCFVRTVLTALLIVVTVINLIPYIPAKAAESTVVSALDQFMNPSGNVGDYSDGSNPYGYGDGQVFTMSTQDELLHFYSYNVHHGSPKKVEAMTHSVFNSGSIDNNGIAQARMSNLSLDDGATSSASWEVRNPFNSENTLSVGDDYVLENMQAVAFDALDKGHNNHVAIMGVDKNGVIKMYVMDAESGDKSDLVTLGSGTHLSNNKLQPYEAANYLAITVGRYKTYVEGETNGETVVLYYPGDGGTLAMKEFAVTESNGKPVVSCISSTDNYKKLLHSYYMTTTDGNNMKNKNDVDNDLQVALATGDFDGDRIDDLAILSSLGDTDGDFDDVDYRFYIPQLYVVYGGGNGSIIDKTTDVKSTSIYTKLEDDSDTQVRTMMSPSVTAGDADGDGLDDVITAGWQVLLEKEANNNNTKKRESVVGVTVGMYNGNSKSLSQLAVKAIGGADGDNETGNITNHWSHKLKEHGDGDFTGGGEFTFPQYVVEAVAINGDGAEDYIFMNGTFCVFDQNEGLKYVHTPEYFQHQDSNCEGKTINVEYIASTAVGVFDHNTVGREQIIVSVGLKESGSDDYFFLQGTMGGTSYSDRVESGKVKQYGTAQEFYSTAFDRAAYGQDKYDYRSSGSYQVFEKGAGDNGDDEMVNYLVVAVDIGKDGVLAKYTSKHLVYTDPNLVAVLQAAPYFADLDGTSGETSYTVSTEYTIGQSESSSTSFSVGVSTELEGPGVKVALGSGYSASWAESFESDFTKAYGTTFTAGANNQVIMQRIPVVVYCYTVTYGDDKWNDEVQVSIPGGPLMVQLTIPEYNAFTESFNKALKESDPKHNWDRLLPIDENIDYAQYLLNNEGNPKGYVSAWSKIPGAKNLSDFEYGVTANDTGSTASDYSEADSTTKTKEKTDGFYVNASIGTGASFLVGSAYVGVDTTVEGEWTIGTYSTTTKYESASGKVSNLGSVTDLSSDVRGQYGFSWTFGKWSIVLDTDNPAIPVYGFQVKDVRQPLGSPRNLKVEDAPDSENGILISWDPTDEATRYNVYYQNDYGEVIKLGSTPYTEYTYNYQAGSRLPYYTFMVSALKGTTEGRMSDKIIYYPRFAGMSAYELAKEKGFTGDEQAWLDSLQGKDGKDGVGISQIVIDETGQLIVTLTNGNQVPLGIVVGKDGKDGKDGVGIDEIVIDENGNLVVTLSTGIVKDLGKIIGKDGYTPYVGENGNWFINGVDTGYKAVATDGIDGKTPYVGENGNWFIDGTDTGFKALGIDGKDGIDGNTPYVGENGNWFIDGTDTGYKALATDGKDGIDGNTPYVGENGNWFIDGTDTGYKAIATDGKDGKDGTDGKDGINGTNGRNGVDGKDGVNGKDGKDGADGKDGINGADGKDGKDGVGIKDVKINADGQLVITLTDGTTLNAGNMPEEGGTDLLSIIAICLAGVALLWNIIGAATKKKEK